MSTGLTWVTSYDYNAPAPGPVSVTWAISFNDYSEALEFVLWNAKLTYALVPGSDIYYYIYTSGPNQNGWVNSNSAIPTFIPFD